MALFYLLGLISLFVSAAPPPEIVVMYPELDEPYRGVFSSIIEGIQEQSKVGVRLLSIGEGSDISQSMGATNLSDASVIIALGRTGLANSEHWRGKVPIVVGALLLTPDKDERGLSGISLAASPDLLLERLHHLAPSVKRVHVVYSPRTSEWLVDIARGVASKFNFQLRAYKSNDIKSSALIYRDILNKSRPGEDAIWLLPDPVAVDNKITLPLLLRGAWNNNVLLFSSNPAHVKRGALFALFPDNKSMGMSLARMAESYLGDDAAEMRNTVIPLRDLEAAINVRTADHIGLTLSNEDRKEYALIFPAP
jgi:putative ABC transport system substrate-binding protein